MRRPYTTFVTIFWLTMMGILFQKEVLPSFLITNPTGYKIALTKDNPVRESWMGIYFKDKKIGFSNTVVSEDIKDGIAGYRISETSLLRLNMLGKENLVRIKGTSFFDENYMLRAFDYKLLSGGMEFSASGELKGDSLRLTIYTGGEKQEKILKIKKGTIISTSISPMLLFKKVDKSRDVTLEIFDPITFGTNKITIKKVGKEIIEFHGDSYKTYVFETDISGIKTKTWVQEDGDILKEESLLGFTMYKESSKEALEFAHRLDISERDLISEFSVQPHTLILNPRAVSYLKIERNGEVEEIVRDKEPPEDKILAIPIKEIPEEDFIQSKNKRIIELARTIVGDEKNSWLAAIKILHWVYDNIKKAPTLSIPSSLDVLRTRQGDCNEHTVLFTALARAVGIPTEMVAGLVYLEDAFYYHAWPRVYVGEWINMDPTLGQEIADATHIPLLEGGLKEQLKLIRIIGDLKIEVLEYAKYDRDI